MAFGFESMMGYLTWTADNETDRGNSYPAGDATSLTLSGLPEGTEFKVQVRARYYDGAHMRQFLERVLPLGAVANRWHPW